MYKLKYKYYQNTIRLFTVTFVFSLKYYLSAADLTVGFQKEFSQIQEALDKAQPGDKILVYPKKDGLSYEKVALSISKSNLSIIAVNEGEKKIILDGQNSSYSGIGSTPRAIIQFNKNADNCIVEGFELLGAHNESHNAAGIRINQANKIMIRSCSIHDNDMGIMSNGDGTPNTAKDQIIENCLIYRNGSSGLPGQSHNLYLGGTNVLIRGSEIHSSLTGHNIKSRAHKIIISASYIHDSANREIDLVDAEGDTDRSDSDAIIIGNIIVKSKFCPGNRTVIHFGQDGSCERNGTLYLINNTIITPYVAPVVHFSSLKTYGKFFNNIVYDGGTHCNGQTFIKLPISNDFKCITGSTNWFSSGFKTSIHAFSSLKNSLVGNKYFSIQFINSEKGDYQIMNKSEFIGKGLPLSEDIIQAISGNFFEYKHPQKYEVRIMKEKMDLGACEFSK
ncbi:MAG TPA: hypothetical protein PLN24_02900 [Victivallales bacterium]|nr:hypothetical protein [Victivallales bacterium]HPO90501.1 hypothetical protein [Victivallales bacterium]